MMNFKHLENRGEELANKADAVYCDIVDITFKLLKRAKQEENRALITLISTRAKELQAWMRQPDKK